MRIRKRWLILAAALVVVSVPLIAAQQRYISPQYPYSVCETCHAKEGFLPVELVSVVPPEVKPGQTFNVSLVIVNPWEHNIRHIDAALNISLAQENVAFKGGGSSDTWNESGAYQGQATTQYPITTAPGLTNFTLNFTGSSGLAGQNEWRVTVLGPGQDKTEIADCTAGPAEDPSRTDQPRFSCQIQLPENGSEPPETGDWAVRVALEDTKSADATHRWSFNATATYDIDVVNRKSYQTDPSIDAVGPFGQQRITWPVQATTKKGEYTLQFQTNAQLYFDHETHSTDTDVIDDSVQVKAEVGDEYVPAETNVGGVEVKTDTTAFMRSWGKVTGFASLLMIVPSFLFVGVFSKHNKYAMNRFFGSARNRVVWHAAVSWIIILLATVHTALFLMEPRFDEFDFVGFKWISGWSALALMSGLGVSGLFQIPLTKKMGYKWWRWLHMYMGISALILSVGHTLWDGEEFAWLTGEKTKTVGMLLWSLLG